ncbi:hypothetical protein Nepgr_006559 [Nepenthes gracilis]|uniref:Uncharacterized protein n=1 Tax=Nepenthes gracilis TaxID=150966 RepID=A0AAD3S5L2_NEPGR|nr:hypothetical protein Nepgr_006559 [Nepenthes gracilis]
MSLNMLGAPGFGDDLIGCECIPGLSFTLAAGGGHALRASVLRDFFGLLVTMCLEEAVLVLRLLLCLWLDMLWALFFGVSLLLPLAVFVAVFDFISVMDAMLKAK